MGGYYQNLESRNWVPGGNVSFSMDGLPPQTRVRSIQITVDLVGTKSAADAVSGDQFYKVLSNIKLGTYVNIGGPELAKLNWMQQGHVVEDPKVLYSIPGTGTSFSLYAVFDLVFREPRSPASDDGSLPSELLSSRSLELSTSSNTVFSVGTLQITGGTIRCAVERIHETNIPMLTRIGYVDASSQTIRLESGVYKDLMLTKQDGTTLSSTDISAVDVIADGRPILQNMRFEQLVALWNRTGYRNGSTTGRGELSKSAAEFLPLCWMDNSGKSNITKQMLVEKDLIIQLNGGSLSNPRLSYAKVVHKDSNAIAQIAQVIGVPPDATVYEPATASKTPPHGIGDGKPSTKKVDNMYGIMAGKFRRGPTPGNKLAPK